MRTTLHIDDQLLAQASRLTGVREKTALVRMGLEALVARASAQRLALGHLQQREPILALLDALPQTALASHTEVLTLTREHRLAGSGLGYVDAHLLASALLSGVDLLTRDRTLDRFARRLGIRS